MLWGAVEQTCGVLTLMTMVLLLMMIVVLELMMMVVVPLADDHGALVVDDVNGA